MDRDMLNDFRPNGKGNPSKATRLHSPRNPTKTVEHSDSVLLRVEVPFFYPDMGSAYVWVCLFWGTFSPHPQTKRCVPCGFPNPHTAEEGTSQPNSPGSNPRAVGPLRAPSCSRPGAAGEAHSGASSLSDARGVCQNRCRFEGAPSKARPEALKFGGPKVDFAPIKQQQPKQPERDAKKNQNKAKQSLSANSKTAAAAPLVQPSGTPRKHTNLAVGRSQTWQWSKPSDMATSKI